MLFLFVFSFAFSFTFLWSVGNTVSRIILSKACVVYSYSSSHSCPVPFSGSPGHSHTLHYRQQRPAWSDPFYLFSFLSFYFLHFPPYITILTLAALLLFTVKHVPPSRYLFVVFPIGKLIPHHLQGTPQLFSDLCLSATQLVRHSLNTTTTTDDDNK